jgi:CheY-like chemotaxis protein
MEASVMATGKRALIVDDSRSARVILSRMLEQHGMTVDTAESAEQALEYLQQTRPDVIFMDHLMPGMDGFQAVQAIKSDAQTATIPLMMYTSQEGELYVSQARALGAVGVLPKTVRPVDVSRVLYQLHLLPDRRQNRSALFEARAAAAAAAAAVQPSAALAGAATAGPYALSGGIEGPGVASVPPEAAGAVSSASLSELQSNLRQAVQQLVRDQFAEQRRFTLATFEAFARRMTGEIKETAAKLATPATVEQVTPETPPRQWWPVLLTALLAVVPAIVLGGLYWRSLDANRELSGELSGVRTALETTVQSALESQLTASRAASATGPGFGESLAPPAGPLAVEYVPYGETPFANARLERLRGLAATLESQRFSGRIIVESFVGDFCLTGNTGEGYALADAGMLAQKCELVGNPFDDSLSLAQRQSVDFANFAATLRQRTGGAISVEIVNAGRRSPIAYPEQTEDGTAGDWNTVAAQNNRVEFRLVPGA